MLHLVVGVLAGAAAGQAPARLGPVFDLGWFGNAVTGALGGLLGQRLIGAGLLDLGGGDLAALAAAVLTGAAGGGVLAALGGLARGRPA